MWFHCGLSTNFPTCQLCKSRIPTWQWGWLDGTRRKTKLDSWAKLGNIILNHRHWNAFPKSYINRDFSQSNQILTLTSQTCCVNGWVGGLTAGQRTGLAGLRGVSPWPSQTMPGWRSHGPVHATPGKARLLTDKCVYRFLEGNFYVICLK